MTQAPPRLIQVFQNPSSSPGGTEKVMGRIAHVAGSLGFSCEEIHEGSYALRTTSRKFTMLNPLGNIVQLSYRARRRLAAADVVVSHGIYGPFLAGRRRIHVFHQTHSGMADAIRPYVPRLDYLVARHLWGGVYERLSCRAGVNVAVSESVTEQARRYYGVSSRQIPNTIDPLFLVPPSLSVQDCRRKLSLPEEALLFLVVGRRERLKGWTLCQRVLDELPGNSLLVSVGSGPALDHPRLVVRQPVEPAELPFYYRAADWTLSPSMYEGFGLTLLESWASGTPVLATPTGIAGDLGRKNSEFSRFVALRCDCADSLLRLLHHAAVSYGAEQVRWGRQLLEKEFSEEQFRQRWSELLQRRE